MMNLKRKIFLSVLLVTRVFAGPYAPAAGQPGTTAIALDDPIIERWATGVSSYVPGTNVDSIWQDTTEALGEAEGVFNSVVSLGRAGEIILTFSSPVANRPGPDFAIFENAFSSTFLELAFVAVSSDGLNFVSFDSFSETESAVGGFGSVDPTNIHGLAGKYQQGYGTPFDLSDLPISNSLDLSSITHLRLIDIIGGTKNDSLGRTIYDPFPTNGSAGFDLDGVAVLNSLHDGIEVCDVSLVGDAISLTWKCEHGADYRIEKRNGLSQEWEQERVVTTSDVVHTEMLPLSISGGALLRVVQISGPS